MEEGKVVLGFAVAAGRDPAGGFQPGVGAFDRPAVAGLGVGGADPAASAPPDFPGRCPFGDRLAGPAGLADPRCDLPFDQRLLELFGGVAPVGPQLTGADVSLGERVDQGQQVPAFVLVAGRESDLQGQPVRVDG